MFIGEYEHSVDQKGRIIIPSKYREELGSVFYVTKGLEKCLYVYSSAEWNKIQEKLEQLPITTNKNAGAFVRFFLSGACECEMDKQRGSPEIRCCAAPRTWGFCSKERCGKPISILAQETGTSTAPMRPYGCGGVNRCRTDHQKS